MKLFIAFLFMTMCLMLNSVAQETDKKAITPKENSKVTREYDENGNLIRFDSVYTYSWSGDTTLLPSLSPENFPDPFGNYFRFSPDSALAGNPFFDGFEQFFGQPFRGEQDSALMKKFGIHPPLHYFQFYGDSLSMNFPDFGDFFNNFRGNRGDSISVGEDQLFSQPKSMDEMMKMLQQQMNEMEERHRKFFKEEPKRQEF